MRQAIRALGWAIIILWVIAFLLPITIGLSLLKLLEPNALGFKEPISSFSNGTFSLSTPFYINNTGSYDLSDLNITILIGSHNKTISRFSTVCPNVPAGTMLNSSYDISFTLEEIASNNMDFLTDDANLSWSISTSFRVAYVIALGISTDLTTLWGAPFYNLTVSEVSYDLSSRKLTVPVGFENHAHFSVEGMILIKICNNRREVIGSTTKHLNIPSGEPFHDFFKLTIDPSRITKNGVVQFYLENAQILEEEWSLSE